MEKWEDILNFWRSAGTEKWFAKNIDFDTEITNNFLGLYEDAAAGRLDHWASDPDGCLALIILLDQFSRNMFRNDPRAFAADEKALELARLAVERGYGEDVDPDLAAFMFMPFMHSEVLEDQETSVELQRKYGAEGNVKAALWHLEIIERFGRFPHRNPLLGRKMSQAEQAYLDGGGFAG